MNHLRTLIGLWLLRPWLEKEYLRQKDVWQDAQVSGHVFNSPEKIEAFQFGVLMAIRRLYDGREVYSDVRKPS